MSLTRLALGGLALALSAAPALAIDPAKRLDLTRYHGQDEHFDSALPRDVTGRYPRPSAIGNDNHVPVGAYLPVPPNSFNAGRRYALGEAAVAVPAPVVRKGYLGDAKGRAGHDRRGSAWGGEPGGRRALVEAPEPAFGPAE